MEEGEVRAHTCHAHGCAKAVPPKLLMCLNHWRMVPRHLQSMVWRHYRPGQEIDKNPSREYLLAQRAAVWAVFVAEGRERSASQLTSYPQSGISTV